MRGMGEKGGRAVIVNEAHALRKDVIRQLLVALERNRVVGFAITGAGGFVGLALMGGSVEIAGNGTGIEGGVGSAGAAIGGGGGVGIEGVAGSVETGGTIGFGTGGVHWFIEGKKFRQAVGQTG